MQGIVRQSLIYTVANLASRGALVVSLLILPHLLTPAEYGALGMVAVIAAFAYVVVPLEISQGLARYYATAGSDTRSSLAGTAWLFTLGSLAVAAVAAWLLATPISRTLLGSAAFADAFRIAIAFIAVNAVVLFLQNQCRWEFRVVDYVWISVGFAATSLGFSILLAMLMPDALVGALTGQVIGGGIFALAGAWRLRAILFHRPGGVELRRMLAFSLPLVPASIALTAGVYASRMFLNGFADLAEVGIFTFASQIATMPGLTILGIQAALTPLIMASHAKPETPPAIARLFEGFIGIAGLVCAGFGLFAAPAIQLFGDPLYLPAAPLVMILAPAFLGLQLYIFSPGFAIAERTRLQMTVTIVGTGLGVALSYGLTRAYGMTGAAWSTLIGAILFIALWFALSRRLYPVPIRWRRVIAFLACWAAVGIVDANLPSLSMVTLVAAKLMLLIGLAIAVPTSGLLSIVIMRSALAAAWIRVRPAPG